MLMIRIFLRVSESEKDVTMETKVRVREIWRCYAAGFEDGEKGHALRKQRVLLLKLERARQRIRSSSSKALALAP